MLARRLHIQLTNWHPNDYSEDKDHDHELEWYLWFEGRQAFSLFDTGPSDLVPAFGHFKDTRSNIDTYQPTIYPLVVNNRFKVRLVAIERDGPQWLDPDDRAKGEFYIDLDVNYPVSDWRIIAADPRKTDLNVEASFRIHWLEYVVTDEIPEQGPPTIMDTSNFPYPWGAQVMVFEHWLGLGSHAALQLVDGNRASRREYWSISGGVNNPGQLKRMVQDVYRFDVNRLGIANDIMSSLYVPRLNAGNVAVTLYQHAFSDSRFAQGGKKRFGSVGLYNLSDHGFDDRASAVEVVHTYPKRTSPDVH